MYHQELIDLPTDIALAELKRQLAEEESEKQKAGTAFPHNITPSVLLQKVLEIEAAQ